MKAICGRLLSAGLPPKQVDVLLSDLSDSYFYASNPSEYYFENRVPHKRRGSFAKRLRALAKAAARDHDAKGFELGIDDEDGTFGGCWTGNVGPSKRSISGLLNAAAEQIELDVKSEHLKTRRSVILDVACVYSGKTKPNSRHMAKDVATIVSLMLGQPITPEVVKKTLQREKKRNRDKTEHH